MTQYYCIDNAFIYQISWIVVSWDFERAGVGLEVGDGNEGCGDAGRDRCTVYLCQKLIIHEMNHVGRVIPPKFGGIIRQYGASSHRERQSCRMSRQLPLAGWIAPFSTILTCGRYHDVCRQGVRCAFVPGWLLVTYSHWSTILPGDVISCVGRYIIACRGL